jgi:hemerythrin
MPMPLVRWDDKYLLGQEQIDDEHRSLFAMINAFYDAFMEDRDRARVLSLLNRLVDYAQRHFTNEERLMLESGYADLDAHRLHHERLFEQIFRLNEKLQDRTVNPAHDTVKFLRNWLSDHIIQEDLILGAHLHKLRS